MQRAIARAEPDDAGRRGADRPDGAHAARAGARRPARRRSAQIVVRQASNHAIRVADVARVEDGEEEQRPSRSSTASRRSCSPCASSRARTPSQVVDARARAARRRREDAARPATSSRSCATTRASCAPASARSRSTWSLGALLGVAGRAPLPRQPALGGHRGHRHPDLDHRHLRAHVGRGLHAQHDHAAGAGARRRHRHRRRHRRAREHPPLHRREALQALPRRGRWRPRTSASPCSRRRCRSWPCSSRSRSCRASSAASSTGFGLTMAFAIGVSMLVSFSLTPTLSARWLDPPETDADGNPVEHKRLAASALVDALLPADRARLHGDARAGSMRHRWVVVLASRRRARLVVPLGKARARRASCPTTIRAPSRSTCARPRAPACSRRRSSPSASRGRSASRSPASLLTTMTIGDTEQRTPNKASIYVAPHRSRASATQTHERDHGAGAQRDRRRASRKELRIDVSQVDAFNSGQSTAAVQYGIYGPDLDKLGRVQRQDRRASCKKVPGAVDVDTNLVVGKPELQVSIDREKAADLGVQVVDIAQTLQLLVGGLKVSTYAERRRGLRRARARRAASTARDARGLSLVTVPSARYGSVPLSEVVSLEGGDRPVGDQPRQPPAPGRRAGQRRARLRRQRRAARAREDHRRHAPAGELSGGAAGALARRRRARRTNFMLAFGLSFIFMYLVLAAQFESWLHPITILLCLPLTVPFALLVAAHLPPVAQHLHGARPARALRRREEELDLAGRPHQQPARQGHGRGTRRSCRPTRIDCGRS